ncbi:hypothetical protein SprV_0200735300 [Sparganum proliferum]
MEEMEEEEEEKEEEEEEEEEQEFERSTSREESSLQNSKMTAPVTVNQLEQQTCVGTPPNLEKADST